MGKTQYEHPKIATDSEHPHVRGENQAKSPMDEEPRGTSPRAWGKRNSRFAFVRQSRNIPTCVGKTAFGLWQFVFYTEHPHVRGENCSAV